MKSRFVYVFISFWLAFYGLAESTADYNIPLVRVAQIKISDDINGMKGLHIGIEYLEPKYGDIFLSIKRLSSKKMSYIKAKSGQSIDDALKSFAVVGGDDLELYFQEPNNITVLDLSGNRLTYFSEYGVLSNLEFLRLRDNHLTSFKGGWLTHLIGLNLNSNRLVSFEGSDSWVNLGGLFLRNNLLTSFRGSSSWKKLKSLGLNGNKLREFDGSHYWPNLMFLELKSNHLSSFDDGCGWENLDTLVLDNNRLSSFYGCDSWVNMKSLYLKNNSISIFEGRDSWGNIRDIGLNHNNLSSFKKNDHWTKLRHLLLKDNENLPCLESNWGENLIIRQSAICDESLELTKILKIKISENINERRHKLLFQCNLDQESKQELFEFLVDGVLWDFSSDYDAFYFDKSILGKTILIYMKNPERLDDINMKGNYLEIFENFYAFDNLIDLDLSSNDLTGFEWNGSLGELITLNLSDNKLTYFSGAYSWGNIELLNLNVNIITHFEAADSWVNLEELHLKHNSLVHFSAFDSWTNLKILDLSFNSLRSVEHFYMWKEMRELNLMFNPNLPCLREKYSSSIKQDRRACKYKEEL